MNTEKKNMNIVWAVVICLVFIGVLIFISINNKVNMPSTNDVNNVSDSTIPAENLVSAGDVAKAGDVVSMNYTGRLENGTVFDSNVDPKFSYKDPTSGEELHYLVPLIFTLGAGQMIPGFDKGVLGMKIGEKKTLTLPPEEAYGPKGQGIIPPNATLIFDVELLKIN
jgi:FKBP-type peptidyl-prolyl cis-trans isomerase